MAKQESAEEKIARLIDDRITAALGDRDRKAKEDSDPWAKLEGTIERVVDQRLKVFMDDLAGDDEGGDDAGDGEPPRKLGVLGL